MWLTVLLSQETSNNQWLVLLFEQWNILFIFYFYFLQDESLSFSDLCCLLLLSFVYVLSLGLPMLFIQYLHFWSFKRKPLVIPLCSCVTNYSSIVSTFRSCLMFNNSIAFVSTKSCFL